MSRRPSLALVMVFLLLVSCVWRPNQALSSDLMSGGSYVGPGKHETELYIKNGLNDVENGEWLSGGKVAMWNTREEFLIRLEAKEDWKISEVRVYVGADPIPVSQGGTPKVGFFPYKKLFSTPVDSYELALDLIDDLNFTWGRRDKGKRIQNVAVYARLEGHEQQDKQTAKQVRYEEAWAYGEKEFASRWGWWTRYAIDHPMTGHFVDAPVGGLEYQTGTFKGRTNASGAFDYFPGEKVALSIGTLPLGTAAAGQKVSPLDLVGTKNLDDPRVINMARLLQSLDADGDPIRGISITETVADSLRQTMEELTINEVDFADSELVDSLITGTLDQCSGKGLTLKAVSVSEARANLDKGLSSAIFRKNISKTPEMETAKAKLELMPVYVPARKANGEPVQLEYIDAEGNVAARVYAKPLVVIYADGIPDTGGVMDVFGAVSRDEGDTWKLTNLSRSAARSSFTLADGTEYLGDCRKPIAKIQGNKILVTWTSKYARSGRPSYAISTTDDYVYDDHFYQDDIWGVGGPQRSVDYTEMGYPEVGEIPFSCIWTCRGIINPVSGEITWFKPERLTSGRRDAFQVTVNAAQNAGFAVTWQEDPEGLRPGEEAGPGEGWSGATTNHKTDIWYSYIKWGDFEKVDPHFESGGEPEHEDDEGLTGRPKALVPMSLPVRVSDNDTLNSENLMAVKDATGAWIPETDPETGAPMGSHRYGYMIPGLCSDFYEKINNQGVVKNVCVTADGRLLDGDTGASRPNLMLQPYQKSDGTYSAWAVLGYEETKGFGSGPPEKDTEADSETNTETDSEGTKQGTPAKGQEGYVPDLGKNVIYHSFDFSKPDLVSAGAILNPQATDEEGNLLYLEDEDGNPLLDWKGDKIPAYENARRPRFLIQSKKNALGSGTQGTVMVALFKMGEEGKGRPSDIFMLRWSVRKTDSGNPYRIQNLTGDIQNISSVTPTETWLNPDSQSEKESIKVVRWEQTGGNLDDFSWENPYDDGRAHRGFIRGNFLAVAYVWTPNWAASRNGNDVYNLYIRRSFDGGDSWTTDPEGDGVEHRQMFKDPETKEREEVCTVYEPGQFEPARNVSQLGNTKESVIEPRLVGVPGTILTDGAPVYPEDNQNPNAFWVTYGTESNPGRNDEDPGEPLDLYYSYSVDRGENYFTVNKTINPDGNSEFAGDIVEVWDWLAKDTGNKTAQQAECQIRMTPDGSIFYAVWNETGPEGSDVVFRRIMLNGASIETVDLP